MTTPNATTGRTVDREISRSGASRESPSRGSIAGLALGAGFVLVLTAALVTVWRTCHPIRGC